jgi:hypothetical protein
VNRLPRVCSTKLPRLWFWRHRGLTHASRVAKLFPRTSWYSSYPHSLHVYVATTHIGLTSVARVTTPAIDTSEPTCSARSARRGTAACFLLIDALGSTRSSYRRVKEGGNAVASSPLLFCSGIGLLFPNSGPPIPLPWLLFLLLSCATFSRRWRARTSHTSSSGRLAMLGGGISASQAVENTSM